MIQKISLICGLLIVAGFGPAIAQDLFINKYKSDEQGGKPTLFLKPKPSSKNAQQSAVQYGKNRVSAAHRQKTLDQIESLKDIREFGLTPRNAEEMLIYADAHRAQAQDAMYKRQQVISKRVAQENEKVRRRVEEREAALSAEKAAAFEQAFGQNSVRSSGRGGNQAVTQKAKQSRNTKYFVRSPADKAQPSRVFKNFR